MPVYMPAATRHAVAGRVIPITLPVACPAIWVVSTGAGTTVAVRIRPVEIRPPNSRARW